MHACTVLAAGMRVTRALDRLILDDNPIGLDGGAAIVEALARGYVGCVTLANCNFANSGLTVQHADAAAAAPPPAGGAAASTAAPAVTATGRTAFDVKRPNHVYRLQLAHVADYNVAGTLVQYWAHDTTAGGPWKSATLDGKVRVLLPALPCCPCAWLPCPHTLCGYGGAALLRHGVVEFDTVIASDTSHSCGFPYTYPLNGSLLSGERFRVQPVGMLAHVYERYERSM